MPEPEKKPSLESWFAHETHRKKREEYDKLNQRLEAYAFYAFIPALILLCFNNILYGADWVAGLVVLVCYIRMYTKCPYFVTEIAKKYLYFVTKIAYICPCFVTENDGLSQKHYLSLADVEAKTTS